MRFPSITTALSAFLCLFLLAQGSANAACNYEHAGQNAGWGWDPVASQSCRPLTEPTPPDPAPTITECEVPSESLSEAPVIVHELQCFFHDPTQQPAIYPLDFRLWDDDAIQTRRMERTHPDAPEVLGPWRSYRLGWLIADGMMMISGYQPFHTESGQAGDFLVARWVDYTTGFARHLRVVCTYPVVSR